MATRGYRAVLELKDDDALETAERVFHSWVNEKYGHSAGSEDVDWHGEGIYRLGERHDKHGDAATLTVTLLRERSQDAHYARQLLELVEERPNGRWLVRLYAMRAAKGSRYRNRGGVLWVEVIPPSDFDYRTKPPRLIRKLLDEGVYDGSMPLTDHLEEIRDHEGVDRLIKWIHDPDRRASIVVGAPLTEGNSPKDAQHERYWRDALIVLTKESLGCATYVALSPASYDLFQERIDADLRIPRASLRTYAPRVCPNDPLDYRRHRVLTANRLLDGYDEKAKKFQSRLAALIARTPRTYLWENGLDSELQRAARVLDERRLSVPTHRSGSHHRNPVDLVEEVRGRDTDLPVSPAPMTESMSIGVREETTGETCVETSGNQEKKRREHRTWFLPLRSLIRRFLPSFAPTSPRDLQSGIDAVSRGLDEMNIRYDELDKKYECLRDELETHRELLEEAKRVEEDQSSKLVELRKVEELKELQLAEEAEEQRALKQKIRQLVWEKDNPSAAGRDYAAKQAEDQLDESPASMSQLYDWMTGESFETVRRYVVFSDPCAMEDDMLDIDSYDPLGRYAAVFWEYILVLRDYMRAREAGDFRGGSVHEYLAESRGQYRTCSQTRHRPIESETVRGGKRTSEERTFRVPEDVDPRGRIEMWAHFAPTHRDQNAPRMHYYADTRNTHKVYIGYIGPHLKNTKTN
jgi:hypothetical protein